MLCFAPKRGKKTIEKIIFAVYLIHQNETTDMKARVVFHLGVYLLSDNKWGKLLDFKNYREF